MREERRGVLMMAYGSPQDLDDMPAYLQDIRGGREAPQDLVDEMRSRYEKAGGSPLNRITGEQAQALASEFSRRGYPLPVFVGMRHWQPRIASAVQSMREAGITRAVAIVMAPHYSSLSVHRYAAILDEAARNAGIQVHLVQEWWRQPRLTEAFLARIGDALGDWAAPGDEDLRFLFTAHSLPQRIVKEGDPYVEQLSAHARLLAGRLGLAEGSLAFQSVSERATEPWLGPDLMDEIPRLAAEGCRKLLVTPIGFVCDHVEILYDIDEEAMACAREHGIELRRPVSLNTHPDFIAAVADAVQGGWTAL